MNSLFLTLILLVGITLLQPGIAEADSCTDLVSAQLSGATITTATDLPAGSFTTPTQVGLASSTITVPALCRVQLVIDPQINAEVWLPVAWNGRFEGAGNGGEFGAIVYSGLLVAVDSGYAGVSSDLGHQSTSVDASWGLNEPTLIDEFGYSATHLMTVAAKTIITDYYGTPASYSYFYGTSAGGRQSLMEAEMYPLDYNGIIADAPAQGWTHVTAGMINQQLALQANADGSSQITSAQATALNKAVVAACDALDGVTDGIIEDPTQCHFDPSTLACTSSSKRAANSCLTPAQITTVKRLYSPLTDSSGTVIYPGLAYGSEYEWFCSVLGGAFNYPFANSWFQNQVFANPSWNFQTFDVNTDVTYADGLWASTLNAWSPNLDAFQAAGGKLLLAQGQSDAIITPLNTIGYYNTVAARYGAATESFTRLFMAPGTGHCGPDEPGPAIVEYVTPLQTWVETGVAPASLTAYKVNSRGKISMSRPLCPYPQEAIYNGSGSTNQAKSFTCAVPTGTFAAGFKLPHHSGTRTSGL